MGECWLFVGFLGFFLRTKHLNQFWFGLFLAGLLQKSLPQQDSGLKQVLDIKPERPNNHNFGFSGQINDNKRKGMYFTTIAIKKAHDL